MFGDITRKMRELSGRSTDDEAVEQSFGLMSGRYRASDGEFHEGSPPADYDPKSNRFRANNGQFKSRSQDLGMGEPFDAPAEDGDTSFGLDRDTDGFDVPKL